MSGEGGHSTSARKRKDKKKQSASRHRADRSGVDRSPPAYDLRLMSGVGVVDNDNEEDDDDYEDDEESATLQAADASGSTAANTSSHGVGLLSAFVFVVLLSGLIALGVLIFVGLKDSSKEVSTPIGESRYASILSDFVSEPDTGGGEEDDDDGQSHLLHQHDSGEHGDDEDEGEHCSHEDESTADWGEQSAPSDGLAEEAALPPQEISADEIAAPATSEIVSESAAEEEEGQLPEGEHVDQVAPEEAVEDTVEQQTVESPSPADAADGEDDDSAWTAFHSDGQVRELANDVTQGNADLSSDGTDSPTSAPSDDYENADITNVADSEIRHELDEVDEQIEIQPEKALKRYEAILAASGRATSPRANYGRARSLDILSDKQKSNALLEQSIKAYETIITRLSDVPAKLYWMAAERCVDRLRFRGFLSQAVKIQKSLIEKFPAEPTARNQLAVTYLLLGKNDLSKQVLTQVLEMFPNDGFAKVHFGFILKTHNEDYPTAIRYLREGLASGQHGTVDGRFYFHLGDALARTGQHQEAMDVYEDGAKNGVFLSAHQRSLYNVASLTGRPWWTSKQLSITYERQLRMLEENWRTIRDEGIALLDDNREGFEPENEGLRDTGVWKQFELFARGVKLRRNCARAPKTCKLIDEIPDAANCARGQVKFSVMQPKTHVWAHTGPTNCRIRAHLGLIVPEGVRIRVANETRKWIEGHFIIFDDSFEHEVWHDGDSLRLVLIVDFWHPELTVNQKKTLHAI